MVRQNQRLVWRWKRQWEGREEDRRASNRSGCTKERVVVLLVVVVVVGGLGGLGGLLVLHSVPLESCVRWVREVRFSRGT